MKKTTKGAIAAGAGIVLLVGSAGTLALWNDSASVAAGAVDSGIMTIDATDGAWSDDITLWVPGDTATYTADLEITLAGDNLESQLALDPGSITGDADLLAALDVDMAVGAVVGDGTVTAAGANTFDVVSNTPGSTVTLTVPVTVTVDFPEDSVTGTTAQDEAVDLSGVQFTLTQLAP